jgi:serralysin
MNNCALQNGLIASCFAHQITLLDEPVLKDRIDATGYNAQAWAENIARGYTSPESVVSGWMNSSGHRANILSSTTKNIGCDFKDGKSGSTSYFYWTCDFGKSYDTQSEPTITYTPSPTPSIKPTTTPTPTPSPTSTPRPTVTPTSTPKPIVTSSPTISPSPTPSSSLKPWWCVYVPTYSGCL